MRRPEPGHYRQRAQAGSGDRDQRRPTRPPSYVPSGARGRPPATPPEVDADVGRHGQARARADLGAEPSGPCRLVGSRTEATVRAEPGRLNAGPCQSTAPVRLVGTPSRAASLAVTRSATGGTASVKRGPSSLGSSRRSCSGSSGRWRCAGWREALQQGRASEADTVGERATNGGVPGHHGRRRARCEPPGNRPATAPCRAGYVANWRTVWAPATFGAYQPRRRGLPCRRRAELPPPVGL